MKKIIICISLLLSLTACSYTEIENTARSELNEPIAVGGEPETDYQPQAEDSEINYIQIGETFPYYYSYTENNELVEQGIKGLDITFNDITIYDDFTKSNIDSNECEFIFDGAEKTNPFILLDCTATLNSDNMESSIFYMSDFYVTYREDEDYQKVEFDEPTTTHPMIVYFSKHCNDGDVDMNGRELYRDSDYFVCKDPIKNGESIDFQIGILCAKELVEDDNLFISFGFDKKPNDSADPIHWLDVLGRFKDA